MLRESSKLERYNANLQMITTGTEASGGLPAEAELVGFAEAALGDDTEAIDQARNILQQLVGTEAMIDAAAVIANFQRMVRIADGTGIPLDPPMAMITAGIRDDLGINTFGSADATPKVGLMMRLMGIALGKVMPLLFRRMAK